MTDYNRSFVIGRESDKGRTITFHGCTLRFCRVHQPSKLKYHTGWEANISTGNKDQAKMWKDQKLLVKPDKNEEGRWFVALSRNEKWANGTLNRAPSITRLIDLPDGKKGQEPFLDEIGYDSIGSVTVYQSQYDWSEGQAGNGTSSILDSILVTRLVKASSGASSNFDQNTLDTLMPDDAPENEMFSQTPQAVKLQGGDVDPLAEMEEDFH